MASQAETATAPRVATDDTSRFTSDSPRNYGRYGIEVSHRGTITYSEDEMREYLSSPWGTDGVQAALGEVLRLAKR